MKNLSAVPLNRLHRHDLIPDELELVNKGVHLGDPHLDYEHHHNRACSFPQPM